VRRCLGIAFTGSTYPQTGLLADVALDVDLPPRQLRLILTHGGFVGILPIGTGGYRLFGAVPPGFTRSAVQQEISHNAYAKLATDELQRWFDDYFQVNGTLGDVSWASLFRFHSRIADRFSSGNVFLVGLLVFEGLSRTGGLGGDLGAIGTDLVDRYLSPVHVHVIPQGETAAHEMYAAHRTRLVLIRPDGHIASISELNGPSDIIALITHLDGILLPRPHASELTTAPGHASIDPSHRRRTDGDT
jgi:FAD binding domain